MKDGFDNAGHRIAMAMRRQASPSVFPALAVAIAIIALIAACGDGDPTKPDVTQGYRIQASLLADMQTASVTVIRLDPGDPSAEAATVLLDDAAVPPFASSTPDHAAFRQQVAPELAARIAYRSASKERLRAGFS